MHRPSTLVITAFALVATTAAVASGALGRSVPLTRASGDEAGASVADVAVAEHTSPAATAAKPTMQVYKSATCGCCKEWVTHIKAAGFDTEVIDLDEDALQARKAKLGVGPRLQSCHTAVVNGYVIEGHVPAEDILRMLKEKPAIVGLAAPGMPRGAPGMEMPGGSKDAYNVVAFEKGGATRIFARH